MKNNRRLIIMRFIVACTILCSYFEECLSQESDFLRSLSETIHFQNAYAPVQTTNGTFRSVLRERGQIQIMEQTITGKVIDEEGEPLSGVNILAEGTTIGTVNGFLRNDVRVKRLQKLICLPLQG